MGRSTCLFVGRRGMASEKPGPGGKGSGFQELADHIRLSTASTAPARIVLQSTCGCRGAVFHLEADPREGCARRTCPECGAAAYLADSEDSWRAAEPEAWRCACGCDVCEVAVGFSLGEDDEVSRITVGQRCVRCGRLDCAAAWPVDGPSSDRLFEKT